jgi:hypothetical protein
LEEGNDGKNHIYAKVAELMNLSWSKVWLPIKLKQKCKRN